MLVTDRFRHLISFLNFHLTFYFHFFLLRVILCDLVIIGDGLSLPSVLGGDCTGLLDDGDCCGDTGNNGSTCGDGLTLLLSGDDTSSKNNGSTCDSTKNCSTMIVWR